MSSRGRSIPSAQDRVDSSSARQNSQKENGGTAFVSLNDTVLHIGRGPCFSRTCPVKFTHPSSRETVKGLAIIDDQATVTFVDPSIKGLLRLPSRVLRPSRQATVTINGPSEEKPCHILEGLVVTPLDGQKALTLPPAVMQCKIPSARDQVASKREVANTKGYEQFARHFSERE